MNCNEITTRRTLALPSISFNWDTNDTQKSVNSHLTRKLEQEKKRNRVSPPDDLKIIRGRLDFTYSLFLTRWQRPSNDVVRPFDDRCADVEIPPSLPHRDRRINVTPDSERQSVGSAPAIIRFAKFV